MLKYLARRIVGTIPVIILISLLVFTLIHAAPGDPPIYCYRKMPATRMSHWRASAGVSISRSGSNTGSFSSRP